MLRRSIQAAALTTLLICGYAAAGIDTDPNGMTNYRGYRVFQSTDDRLCVRVDFCVYAPGKFDDSFGFDPTGGTEWFYVYQIFNNLEDHPNPFDPDYVKAFSVGLNGPDDEGVTAGDVGYIDGAGVGPVVAPIATSSTVRWNFWSSTYPVGIHYEQYSDVLYFHSPYGPEWDSGTVSGARSATLYSALPSPLPEPTTALVLAVGGMLATRRRKTGHAA